MNVFGVVCISKAKGIQSLRINNIPSNAFIRTDLAALFNMTVSAPMWFFCDQKDKVIFRSVAVEFCYDF